MTASTRYGGGGVADERCQTVAVGHLVSRRRQTFTYCQLNSSTNVDTAEYRQSLQETLPNHHHCRHHPHHHHHHHLVVTEGPEGH